MSGSGKGTVLDADEKCAPKSMDAPLRVALIVRNLFTFRDHVSERVAVSPLRT
jgi:hypothetical protein